jgi:hypothetical protein
LIVLGGAYTPCLARHEAAGFQLVASIFFRITLNTHIPSFSMAASAAMK